MTISDAWNVGKEHVFACAYVFFVYVCLFVCVLVCVRVDSRDSEEERVQGGGRGRNTDTGYECVTW